MLNFSELLTGKGLNLTSENITKYPCVKEYKVPVFPKYNFIIVDFESLPHQESDLFNFSRALINSGTLIIRQKITHEESYNEVLYHVDLLHRAGSNLKSFESCEDYNYFVFKKESKRDSILLGVKSQDKEKIIKAINDIAKNDFFKNYFIQLHILAENGWWLDTYFTSKLEKFTSVCIFEKYKESSFETNEITFNWNKLISVCKLKKILLINDDFNIENFSPDNKFTNSYIFLTDIKQARKISGIDFRYKTIEWSIYDFSIRMGEPVKEPAFHKEDNERFNLKKDKNLLNNSIRWINIHEALGDNICAFNLLETLKRDQNLYVSTAYSFLYELSPDIKIRHDLWELNGLGFNVYEHGSENKSKSLEYAYFSMNGEEELFDNKRWKYFYKPDGVERIIQTYKEKNVVLLAPSASNREGPSNGLMLSNKTWDFKNWEQIVAHLQKRGYYVIQVGVKEDFRVENVNEYFFNQSFGDLVSLIYYSKFFLGLDTFFQHLCGLMGKKGIVVTPAHNDHAFWPSTVYIVGKVKENFEHLKWIKDHLNPYRAPCMSSISVETVRSEVDKIIDCFNKY